MSLFSPSQQGRQSVLCTMKPTISLSFPIPGQHPHRPSPPRSLKKVKPAQTTQPQLGQAHTGLTAGLAQQPSRAHQQNCPVTPYSLTLGQNKIHWSHLGGQINSAQLMIQDGKQNSCYQGTMALRLHK